MAFRPVLSLQAPSDRPLEHVPSQPGRLHPQGTAGTARQEWTWEGSCKAWSPYQTLSGRGWGLEPHLLVSRMDS